LDDGNIEILIDSRNHAAASLFSGELLDFITRNEPRLLSFQEKIKQSCSLLEDCCSKFETFMSEFGASLKTSSQKSEIDDISGLIIKPEQVEEVVKSMKRACQFYVGNESLYHVCSTISMSNLREFASASANWDLKVSARKKNFIWKTTSIPFMKLFLHVCSKCLKCSRDLKLDY
jgi:hypothetical protein